MPVPDYKTYCKMLDRAREGKFAYPAINVAFLMETWLLVCVAGAGVASL